MADKRELILARIEAIFEGAKIAKHWQTVARNRGLMSNDKRPAIILLDGDEPLIQNLSPPPRSGMAPSIVTMRPEIYYLAKDVGVHQNEQGADNIGTLLNTARADITKLLADDATLSTLLGSNGGLTYKGCVTDLKSGSALQGQMRLDFDVRYAFIPN